MHDLLHDAVQRAAEYRKTVGARPVAPNREALERLALLDASLPVSPSDPCEVLRLLDEIGSPATMATAGGRFFGFVVGGSLPAAA